MKNYEELDQLGRSIELSDELLNVIYAFFDKVCFGDKTRVCEVVLTPEKLRQLFRALKMSRTEDGRCAYTAFKALVKESIQEKTN